MSFKGAHQVVQRNVLNWSQDTKNINLLLAVLESSRTNDITFLDFGPNGKYRTIKLNFIAPICDDDGECDDNICDAGTVIPPSQLYFDITRCTASTVYQVNLDDIRDLDGNITFSDYAMSMMRAGFHATRLKLTNALAAELVSEVGIIPMPDGSGVSSLPISFVDPSTGAINTNGYNRIVRAFADAGLTRNPYIVGGPAVDDFKYNLGLAATNQLGQDLRGIQARRTWYDPIVPQTFADPSTDHILAWDENAFEFVNFSYNQGIFSTDAKTLDAMNTMLWKGAPQLILGTVVDPRTGLLFDLDIHFEPCDKTWKFQWKINWDILFPPQRVCNLDGVNGIYHLTACLPAAIDCPTPEDLSLIEVQEYSFDTSGQIDYTYFIQRIQVGNYAVEFDGLEVGIHQAANITELASILNDFLRPLFIQLEVTGTTLSYEGVAPITIVLNGGTPNDGETWVFTP